jgi:multiple sugar transport system substrate-binding protein
MLVQNEEKAMNKSGKRRNTSLALIFMLVAVMLMAACGDTSPTAGTAATAAGGGTSATTVAGTSATTAPASTAAGGTNATTVAGGTATTVAGGTATTVAGGTSATTAATGATAAGAGSGGQAMTLPANCNNVELQYWNPFTGPDGPFMGTLVSRFNTANPKIKVTMATQAEYYIQLGTASAADTLPDIAIVHADQVATQVYRNILRPIDDLVKDMGVTAGDFPAPVWKAGEVAGKRYAIPLDIHPAVLYYNEDLLKKVGFAAPPKTGDEFLKVAQAANTGGNKGFMVSSEDFSRPIFETLLNQFGGSAFAADGSKATFNSEAGVKAMQWIVDAQNKYSEPKLESFAELNAFKTGNTALVINGIWQTSNITGKSVSFAGKGTAVPQIGSQMAVWANSHQLALTTKKSGADACKDAGARMFIKYVLDNSVEWAKAGQIPASNTIRNSAAFKALDPQAAIAPSVEKAFFPPAVPGISDAYVPLSETVTALMNGQASDIKGALDNAARRSDQILAENKSKYAVPPTTSR